MRHRRHDPITKLFGRFCTPYIAAVGVLVTAGLVSGCSRDEITAPEAPVVGQFTVDASKSWAYVDLTSGDTVPQADAATSTSWDVGFNATSVQLNGGTHGPAGVTGFCVCQNAAATNDQILAMTPDNQEAAFTNVTSASIPVVDDKWTSDVFATNPWYRYDLAGDHRISPTFDVYFVKRGSTVYKLQVINYYGAAGETRRITVRYSKVRG